MYLSWSSGYSSHSEGLAFILDPEVGFTDNVFHVFQDFLPEFSVKTQSTNVSFRIIYNGLTSQKQQS
jgi:hypothetical protein